jgi:hypothetical protein
MSRSYKKTPVIKDGGHGGKQDHARAMRTNVKQILRVYAKQWNEELDEPEFPHPYQITNRYDICDWRTYVDSESRRGIWGRHWFRKNGKILLRK